MRAVPMLIIKSAVPCLLFANNAPVGEISHEHPAGLPMPENGRCYLHYVPLGSAHIPGAFRLDFTSGEMSTPDTLLPARLVRWPRGVVEAEIQPLASLGNSFLPLAPDTLTQLELREGCRAYLLRYVANWLVVEDGGGGTLLSTALPEGHPEIMALNLEGREGVAVRSQGNDEWAVICARDNGGWKELFRVSSARVDVDRNGDVTSLLPMGDTAGHARLTTWSYFGGEYSEQQRIVWFDGEPKLPQTAEEAGSAFLEAWSLGETAEARGYLSRDLSAGISDEEINEFLGSYDRIEAARYAPVCAEDEITLAVVRREGEGLYGARPLAIRCVEEEDDKGKWKIDNIRPL